MNIKISRNLVVNLFYAILYLLMLIVPCLPAMNDFAQTFGFLGGLSLVSVAFFSLLKRKKYFSVLSFFFLVFPCIFYVLNIIPLSINFRGLCSDDIMAVLQTNFSEAYSWMGESLNFANFGILIVLLVLFICLSIKQNKKGEILGLKMSLICLVIGPFLIYKTINNPLTQPIYDSVQKINKYVNFYQNLKYREKLDFVEEKTKEGIYVVVIGESQNRNRMSVYGYTEHNTTPFLSEFIKNKNSFFLDNVSSCHVNTIPALTYALTQKNNYNDLEFEEAYSIIDLLQDFNTFWLSNQKKVGSYSEPITEIGLKAKVPVFINKSFTLSNTYDGDLLELLPNEEKLKGKSVVFIHLIGNHTKYKDRYPDDFKKWDDAYDNTMIYNDYVIQKIYEHFSGMKDFMALVYFSDHADDMKCKCHDVARFTFDMTKIPFFFYFSDAYIVDNSEKIEALKKHKHSPFTNDMAFDTLLGVLNITDKRFYVPENDLLNPKYNHTVATLSTLHGKRGLSEEFLKKYPSKFGLHRVNSPQKLEQLGDRYEGLEMDIIYHEDMGDFENSHDQKSLENYPLSKTLQMYQEQGKKQYLWFDFKNLTNKNKIVAEKKLAELVEKYGIEKKQVWIESRNYEPLEHFTRQGWKTVYYFPNYYLENKSSKEIRRIKETTEKISFSGKISAISFSIEYYTFIRTLNLSKSISLLTWDRSHGYFEFMKESKNQAILDDPAIKVILVKEKGKYHR